jgi:uncharacterized protein DUF6505
MGRASGGSTKVKLLRTIRVDASDTFVFAKAAEPGEWAVSGAFAFARVDPAELASKSGAAFRGGFLGVDSLGRSTLTEVVEASEDERLKAIEALAERLVRHFGAPDLAAGRVAAEEEVAFAASLCNFPAGTLIAVSRRYQDGAIHEQFRALEAGATLARAFDFAALVADRERLR